MRTIIKSRRHLEIPQDIKNYLQQKIAKFGKRLPQTAFIEVVLSDEFGPKGGQDKEVDLTLTLPGEKQPFHFKERTEDFSQSIDLIEEKLEREIVRYKEKRSY